VQQHIFAMGRVWPELRQLGRQDKYLDLTFCFGVFIQTGKDVADSTMPAKLTCLICAGQLDPQPRPLVKSSAVWSFAHRIDWYKPQLWLRLHRLQSQSLL
jgi:hypothetical protein